ncbi:MAG: type II secretion system F family protein [Actinomycetota bacterium]|nr:type II secretion system F family protein [Actinomycetota bacterium]
MPPIFDYKVKDAGGSLITGNLEGDSRTLVASRLKEMGYIVLAVDERVESPDVGKAFTRSRKVKLGDLKIFSRQFSAMMSSGLTLVRALSILTQQTRNRSFAEVIAKVMKDVEAGTSLSSALAKHPKIFKNIFISMVKAGEEGGFLDEIMARLADHYEREAGLRHKIRSAMAYPLAVSAFALLILIAMMLFVVPIFVKMFEDMNAKLPLPTRIIIGTSNALRSYWYIFILGFVAVYYGIKAFAATERGILLIDTVKLKLPVFGELSKKVAISRFARTMATLLASGVPLLTVFDVVSDTSGNALVARDVRAASLSVKAGQGIAKPLANSPIFPLMVTQMIAVGEETGELDPMLYKVADFYDEEVSASVDTLTSLIEPIMIVGVGILIGAILISLYLPMFQLVLLVGQG